MIKLESNSKDTRTTTKRKYFWYKCACGRVVSKRSDSTALHCSDPDCGLSSKHAHGASGTRLHNIWMGIRDRCLYNKREDSKHYLGRGISICTEWLLFSNFRIWALKSGMRDTSL